MPLDGLRAWIGEVERKLGMRTRVFLVLTALAIGGAGAAIYLAVDTREDAVSESDVRELQERLEARIAAEATSAPVPAPEPVEPGESQVEPESKPGESQPEPKSESANGKLRDLLEEAKEQQRKAEEAE
jgi:hypothetical protein